MGIRTYDPSITEPLLYNVKCLIARSASGALANPSRSASEKVPLLTVRENADAHANWSVSMSGIQKSVDHTLHTDYGDGECHICCILLPVFSLKWETL